MKNILQYCKIRKVKSPVRGTSAAAGIDFFVPEDIPAELFREKLNMIKSNATFYSSSAAYDSVTKIELAPGDSVLIPSGIKMKVPEGHALIFFNKSGVGSKKQLDVLAQVIDCDYEGEVHINLVNNGTETQEINAGDKIVQGLILPIDFAEPVEVSSAEELYKGSTSERGEGGFGSTGTN